MTLRAHHSEQLRESAIDDEVIAERGYWSVANRNSLSGMGFGTSVPLPALVLPILTSSVRKFLARSAQTIRERCVDVAHVTKFRAEPR